MPRPCERGAVLFRLVAKYRRRLELVDATIRDGFDDALDFRLNGRRWSSLSLLVQSGKPDPNAPGVRVQLIEQVVHFREVFGQCDVGGAFSHWRPPRARSC